MAASCPTPQTLDQYLAGQLAPPAVDEVEKHLEACPRCVEAADRSSAGRDVVLRAVRWSLSGEALSDEPELAAALGEIALFPAGVGEETGRPADRDAPPTPLIRDYQLIEKLGEGGMGSVYRAVHTRLEKTVAIKILRPDRQRQAQAVQRFEREMRALGSLEHPHIVRALDAGEERGVHFLVMEFIEGIDLGKLVRRLGPLPIADACELARQAALGLAHAHTHDKVHRDVKPGNLMLAADGLVRVLDLGLAQLRGPLGEGEGLTRDDQVMGTRFYMSPEQLGGSKNVTKAADIYSLGVTLYQFLAGRLPLKAGQFALQLPPLGQSRSDAPAELRQIVQAMICRAPDDRLESMDLVASLLAPHAAGADLPGLLRRFMQWNEGGALDKTSAYARSSIESPPITSALQPTEPFHTTDRAPPVPPPLPPPAVERSGDGDGHEGSAVVWGGVAAGLMALAALVLLAIFFWPPSAPPRGPALTLNPFPQTNAPPEAPGRLTLQAGHPVVGEVLDPKTGPGIWLVPRASGDRLRLVEGVNGVPPGEYSLDASWMLDFDVQGQPASGTIKVHPDRELLVRGTVRTDFPWHLPELPTVPGAFAESSGTLSLGPLHPPGVAKELSYTLRLTMLDEVPVAGVPHRWLCVEVTTALPGGKYIERGYLLIDANHYRDQRQLRVARGWIEAETPELREELARSYPEAKPESLVVPFDPRQDALSARAKEQSLPFPAARVSVQMVMALLFKADFAGDLPPEVEALREKIATEREAHFESRVAGRGTEDCLVVTAKLDGKETATYELARSQRVPFSFVEITVKTPVFRGEFHLTDYRVPKLGDTTRYAAPEPKPPTPPRDRENQRLDLISLPREAGARSHYSGQLVAPPAFFDPRTKLGGRTIYYDLHLWVGAAEMIDGVPHRPLQLAIASGWTGQTRPVERAWLMVHEQRYREELILVPHPAHSYVEIGGEVFASDADFGETLGTLYRLDRPPQAERIGVYDALALLCDSDRPAAKKFKELRGQLTAALLKLRTCEQAQLQLPGGDTVAGEIWKASSKEPTPVLQYELRRTRHLPFGIQLFTLEKQRPSRPIPEAEFFFIAELKSFSEKGAAPLANLEPWWREREEETKRKIAELAKTEPVNFRLWKRTDDSVIWAEYMVDSERHVVLRDKKGWVVVERSELSPDDVDQLKLRTWTLISPAASQRIFRAQFISGRPNKWSFQDVGGVKTEYPPDALSPDDRQWVRDLPDARKQLPKW